MRWHGERAAAAVLMVLIAANALRWVFVVPIFQAPDEDLHFDYAMSIYAAGRLIRAGELPVALWTRTSPTAPNTHPLTHHLAVRSGAARMRSVIAEKVPPGYGSHAFYRHVNETMPPDEPQLRNPWLVTEYPFGYYGLTAAWLRLVSLWRSEPVTLIFAARALSVLMLALSMSIAYAYLRRIGGGVVRSMAIVAIAGFFPFTTFVGSYVQPENLALLMTMLACYVARIARDALRDGTAAIPLLGAGVALAGLFVTKYHFFLVVFVTVMPMLLFETAIRSRESSKWARAVALLIVPLFVTGAIQLSIHQAHKETWLQRERALDRVFHSTHWPTLGATRFFDAVVNYFGGGNTFRGFWGIFGWNDTPLIIGSPALDAVIRPMLLAGSFAVLALIGARLFQVGRRLIRIARKRRADAVRVALSNPLANSHFVFVGFMLVVYVWMGNRFLHAAARNWFPFVVSIFWLACEYAPHALRSRRRRRLLSNAILLVVLTYSLVGAWYAIPEIRARFYGRLRDDRQPLFLAVTYTLGERLVANGR